MILQEMPVSTDLGFLTKSIDPESSQKSVDILNSASMIQRYGDLAALLGALLKLAKSFIVNSETVSLSFLNARNYRNSNDYESINCSDIPSKKRFTPKTNFTIVGHARTANVNGMEMR
jgi:hypothetical protein